ncbi:hypothetical protein SCARR_04033 [Pontiella sulfatireligans]|uniref:Uncharacterized protein n=1 Tax=Pontiella sulfatireligans TaxID=2750658 RepID=A0A6C2UPV1_9BACT|nr:hypothetical protein SCARR_04033 [Pontiella sulfatireligans]
MEPAVRVELTTNGLQILILWNILIVFFKYFIQRMHLFCNCFVFSSF